MKVLRDAIVQQPAAQLPRGVSSGQAGTVDTSGIACNVIGTFARQGAAVDSSPAWSLLAGLNGTQLLPFSAPQCTSVPFSGSCELRCRFFSQVKAVNGLRSQCRGRGFESHHLHPKVQVKSHEWPAGQGG